ncbi:MAG: DUF4856 domain-containing protein [Myxococcota bacterium]|nr:DUF4856 domain-containing protein [Myxococcota bacterium]
MLRRKPVGFIGAVVMTLLTIVGCGDSDHDDDTTTSIATDTAADTTATDATTDTTATDATTDTTATDTTTTDTTTTDTGTDTQGGGNYSSMLGTPPDTYRFTIPEAFVDGDETGEESNISYTGQIYRQSHISAIKKLMGDWQTPLSTNDTANLPAEVSGSMEGAYAAQLEAWYNGGNTDTMITESAPVASLPDGKTFKQATLADFGSSKSLSGKIVGKDSTAWDADAFTFAGWDLDITKDSNWASVTKADKADALVKAFFHQTDVLANQFANGEQDLVAAGLTSGDLEPTKYFVNNKGHDFQQLTQKFLLGAVTFSQGCSDYLRADLDGKGVKGDAKAEKSEGANYTVVQHGWDEAFGYWGGSRDFTHRAAADGKTVEETLKGAAAHDTDGNGEIDLVSEHIWGTAMNALKRDVGSKDVVDGSGHSLATSFAKNIFNAFKAGRHYLKFGITYDGFASHVLPVIIDERKKICDNWEMSIAATVVHYINDTLGDMKLGTQVYADADAYMTHAKHWGELKGFALGLQFRYDSEIHKIPEGEAKSHFAKFHELVGDKPVLVTASESDKEAYKAQLEQARGILKAAYGWADEVVAVW